MQERVLDNAGELQEPRCDAKVDSITKPIARSNSYPSALFRAYAATYVFVSAFVVLFALQYPLKYLFFDVLKLPFADPIIYVIVGLDRDHDSVILDVFRVQFKNTKDLKAADEKLCLGCRYMVADRPDGSPCPECGRVIDFKDCRRRWHKLNSTWSNRNVN